MLPRKESEIFSAIRENNLPGIERIIKAGANLAEVNEAEKMTPVQLAACLGKWEIVQEIIKHKKSDDTDSYQYSSALFTAMTAGRPVAEIAALVKAGASLAAQNEKNDTPIMHARGLKWEYVEAIAKAKNTDKDDTYKYGDPLVSSLNSDMFNVARCLLTAGASTNWYTPKEGNRPLHWVVQKQQMDLLNLLLDKNANLAVENDAHQTPVQLAADLGLWDYVTAIVKKKKTDEKDTYRYGYVLLAAIKARRPVDEIRALVEAGADITWRDAEKNTAIQVARTASKWDYVEAIAQARLADNTDSCKYGDALLSAAEANRDDTVKILLDAGPSTGWHKTDSLYTSLHFAVKHRNIKMLEALLDKGASLAAVTSVNENKQTPMQLAASLGYWDVVEFIAKKVKTDDEDTYKYTDVLFSAMKADRPVAEINVLLAAGADLAAQDNEKHTPIQAAAKAKKWQYVEAIAKHYKLTDEEKRPGADPKAYGAALRSAVIADRIATVRILLEANSPLTWRGNDNRNYCVHEAVVKNNKDMLELLTQYKANLRETNKAGQTALDLACAEGHWECASVLARDKSFQVPDSAQAGVSLLYAVKARKLEIAEFLRCAGASVSERDKSDGNTALHQAVINDDQKAIKFLLECNADQTAVNQKDLTPLELAIELQRWDCAQLLLDSGNNNRDDKQRIASLHYQNALILAIQKHNHAIAALLLDHNAPCHHWNSEMGNIALYWAVSQDMPELVALLLDKGADPTIRNKDGKTTHDLASKLGRSECLRRMQRHSSAKKLKPDDKLTEAAEKTFELLAGNAITPECMATTLSSLESSLLSILYNDLDVLHNRLSALKAEEEKNHAEIDRTRRLVAVINSLLNFPQKPVIMYPDNSVEGLHIMMYMQRRKDIDDFINTIKTFLNNLENEIKGTAWKISRWLLTRWILGDWKDGTPEHVEKLQKALLKRKRAKSDVEFVQVYAEVHRILSNIPWRSEKERHPETTGKFYEEKPKEMASISFTTSDPAYASMMVQVPANLHYLYMVPVPPPSFPAPAQAAAIVSSETVYRSDLSSHPYLQLLVQPSAPALDLPPAYTDWNAALMAGQSVFPALYPTDYSRRNFVLMDPPPAYQSLGPAAGGSENHAAGPAQLPMQPIPVPTSAPEARSVTASLLATPVAPPVTASAPAIQTSQRPGNATALKSAIDQRETLTREKLTERLLASAPPVPKNALRISDSGLFSQSASKAKAAAAAAAAKSREGKTMEAPCK